MFDKSTGLGQAFNTALSERSKGRSFSPAFFSNEENLVLELKSNLIHIEKNFDLTGLVIIAKEGVNGTICAEENVIEEVLFLINFTV